MKHYHQQIQQQVLLHKQESNLTYDIYGNLKQGFDQYLEYNELNQLARVRDGNATGQVLEEYAYDNGGERIWKHEPIINQTTYYINDNFIQVVNSTGTYLTTYYYDGDTLIGRKDPDGKKFFYHPDHLGSTDIVTNESGDAVEETTYKPYGEVQSGGVSRFLFTGKELDKESGLYYYGARYYDPFFSHFIQPEKEISDIYNPQSHNRYSYVLNNPYRFIDPTGEVPVDIIVDLGFIAYGAYRFGKDPSLGTASELGLDIAFAALPFVPNLNRIKKGAEAAARARDVERNEQKITETTNRIVRDPKVKSEFLKVEAQKPGASEKYGEAGIEAMKQGRSPSGFQVHHKEPLYTGGRDVASNLEILPKGSGPSQHPGTHYLGGETYQKYGSPKGGSINKPKPQSTINRIRSYLSRFRRSRR